MNMARLVGAFMAGTAFCAGAANAQDTAPADGASTTTQPAAGPETTTGTAPQEAQDTQEGASIIVTAQRRAEKVQDVPISISVVTSQQLERQQVLEVRDLQRTTASLQFGPAGGGSPGGGGFIRGIGTFGFSKASEAAVGIVVDGVVQGNTNITNLFDIGRVEVLRGPQGTLFGQSVSAGVINITTVNPNPRRVEGRASIELSADGFAGSEFGRQIGRAAVNVPVSETSAIRVSAYGAHTNGVSRNIFLGKDEDLKEFGGRARFRGEFGDVTLNLIGDYSKSDIGYGEFFPAFYRVAPGTQLEALLAQCGAEVGAHAFSNCANNKDQVSDAKTWGLSGQVDVTLGEHTLTSITAYRKQLNDLQVDIDRLPNSSLDIFTSLPTNFKQFTQELRLASPASGLFTYTVGAFYQDARTFNDQLSVVNLTIPVPFPPFVLHITDESRKIQNAHVTNGSIFGEGRLNLKPVVLFAGVRVNRNEARQTARYQAITEGGDLLTNTLSYKDTDISWRIGGQYYFTPDVMSYLTVSRGYKGAQIDNEDFATRDFDPDVPIETRVVLPEKPLDVQLGLKSTFLNNRLAVNLNLFHTRVKNYQTNRCVAPNAEDPGTLACIPTNVSKVISKGVEADVFGRVSRNLTLNANFIYNVAKYPSDFVDNAGRSLGSQQLAFAPRWKTTVAAEYATTLSGDLEGFVSADATYKGKTRLGIDRATSDFIYPHRLILGARVGARVLDRWSVALFARNLTNKPLPIQLGNSPPPLGDPAEAGIWQWQNQQSRRLVGLQADFQF